MLLYPSINILNEKTDSRYTLCILTAKRARDIIDGKPVLTSDEQERAVSQAAVEIADDFISYKRVTPEKRISAGGNVIEEAEEPDIEVTEMEETAKSNKNFNDKESENAEVSSENKSEDFDEVKVD